MPARPAKRARHAGPSTSTSPDPLELRSRSPSPGLTRRGGFDDDDDAAVNDEASASHLVSFLTGYADHHSSASSSDGEGGEGRDDFGPPSDEDGDEDLDLDEDGERDTPRKSKSGLVGSSTPRKSAGTPKRRGSKTPGTTPRKQTPRKKVEFGFGEGGEAGEGGIIRPSRADSYFLLHSRSSRTSSNSYTSLAPPLSQKQYEEYISRSSSFRNRLISPSSFETRYEQWSLELEAGFNLLLYGFGSKRDLVNDFAKKTLSKRGHLVVVNGHFPQLGIKDVLSQVEDTIAVPQDIPVPPNYASTPLDRSAYRIYAHFLPSDALAVSKRGTAAKDELSSSKLSKAPLYLIIHNIDSATLRTSRSVSILSLLACSPNIHIVATFDHLHTPIIFSTSLSNEPPHTFAPTSWKGNIPPGRGFNWVYHNVTTYAAYGVELSYLRLSAASSLALAAGGGGGGGGSGISEEGALQILRSVPPMAARLLKLLLTRQLSNLPLEAKAHTAHPAAQVAPSFAIDNDILQTLSREKFIAREEERYNALIGEYKDHGLVVEAPLDAEGRTGKWVWVPLGKAAVERVLETMNEVVI